MEDLVLSPANITYASESQTFSVQSNNIFAKIPASLGEKKRLQAEVDVYLPEILSCSGGITKVQAYVCTAENAKTAAGKWLIMVHYWVIVGYRGALGLPSTYVKKLTVPFTREVPCIAPTAEILNWSLAASDTLRCTALFAFG